MRVRKLIVTLLVIGMCFLITSCGKGVVSFLHANINCSNLEQSISFYEMLGFTAVMSSESEVSAEFAAALGMPPYTLSYAQLIHKDGSLIDLIKWIDPYDDRSPYSNVNHIGIARITLQSTNLDADISILGNKKVEFFSEPASIERPLGSGQFERFVCFKDPDGTIIEIVERGGPGSAGGSDINITGFLSANINCSDIQTSRDFYEMLNFESIMDVDEVGSPGVAAALGVETYQVVGSLMKLNKGPAINLLEWKDPHNPELPYSQLNHLGVPRIALRTTDLDAEVARLKAEGIEFFSEPTKPDGPLAFLKFVCFQDPDGTIIELVELFPGPF